MAKAGKSKSAGKQAQTVRAVKEAYSKSALIKYLAEENDIPRDKAAGVLATLEAVIMGSVHPARRRPVHLARNPEGYLAEGARPQGRHDDPQSRHRRDDPGEGEARQRARQGSRSREAEVVGFLIYPGAPASGRGDRSIFLSRFGVVWGALVWGAWGDVQAAAQRRIPSPAPAPALTRHGFAVRGPG